MDGYDVGGVKFTARDCDKIARYLRKKAAGKNPKLPKGMNEDCIRFYIDSGLGAMPSMPEVRRRKAVGKLSQMKLSLHEVSLAIFTGLVGFAFAFAASMLAGLLSQ